MTRIQTRTKMIEFDFYSSLFFFRKFLHRLKFAEYFSDLQVDLLIVYRTNWTLYLDVKEIEPI